MAKTNFRNASLKALHTGVRITFTVPSLLVPKLELMDNQSVGIAIREALRSAARPATVALKSLLKSELIKSDQSTGATERAVGMKYGRSKRNPDIFYVVVGINTTHFEYHTSKIPDGQITKLRKGRKERGLGLFGLQTRMNKKKVLRSKQVFSRFRDTGRVSKPFKRFPRKYFHLIDKGFNHYRAGNVGGYNFIQRLKQSLQASMQATFEKRLQELIIPVIKREILRKWKRVFRQSS